MLIWKASLSFLFFTLLSRSSPVDDPVDDPPDDPRDDPFDDLDNEPTGGVDSVKAKPDSFYRPPPGFEKTSPGTILRHRRVPRPISLTNVTPIRPKGAWQIQYRTQNSVGEPEANVMTVLEPWNAKPGNLFVEGFFVVSLQLSDLIY
jgi:hypothetical protein